MTDEGTAQPLRLVVSGAPATGKSTVSQFLGRAFATPVLSLDVIKETLADALGLGDENWSDALGDAAAEVVFRLALTSPGSIAEGWWRRKRRDRAVDVFGGRLEVFCTCDPEVAVRRAQDRIGQDRHPIHRDVINRAALEPLAAVVAASTPLDLGGRLVVVDTTFELDQVALVDQVADATK